MQYQEVLDEEEKLNEVAWNLFQQYDTDKTGFLSLKQLRNFMRSVAEAFNMPKPSRREVKAALNDIDDNKDGKLSFEELKPVIL
jgi:Ca2+-binding EF-hand superfamily protein